MPLSMYQAVSLGASKFSIKKLTLILKFLDLYWLVTCVTGEFLGANIQW